MDPVSHAIFGQTLAIAVTRHPASPRVQATAAMLGALAPDVDALLMPFGWDVYLRAHEIGTHTVVGSVVLALLVAAVIRAIAAELTWTDVLWPAWLGCLSHIALDVVSGARVQLAWPVYAGRVTLPLVAMADPWLIAMFSAGAIALVIAWRRRRLVSVAVLGIVVLMLGGKSINLVRARHTLPAPEDASPVLARAIEARWGSLTDWYVFDRQTHQLNQWTIRPGVAPTLTMAWPVGAESPRVAGSRSLATVRNFLTVHDLGFAAEIQQDEVTRVLWSDIRYCWRPEPETSGSGTWPDPIVTTNSATGAVRIACGLWFGGAFDQRGRALSQLVKVGDWWQSRAPAP